MIKEISREKGKTGKNEIEWDRKTAGADDP